jgi:hypothetical protein
MWARQSADEDTPRGPRLVALEEAAAAGGADIDSGADLPPGRNWRFAPKV